VVRQLRGGRALELFASSVEAGQSRSLRDGHLGRESPRPQSVMAIASVTRERQRTMAIWAELCCSDP
jgi:hypothetical protein